MRKNIFRTFRNLHKIPKKRITSISEIKPYFNKILYLLEVEKVF